jgi:hypothetical protein
MEFLAVESKLRFCFKDKHVVGFYPDFADSCVKAVKA